MHSAFLFFHSGFSRITGATPNFRFHLHNSASPNTASHSFTTQKLSQRALEKRPARDSNEEQSPYAAHQTFEPFSIEAPARSKPQVAPLRRHKQPQYRTSFLQTFLARQQNRDPTSTLSSTNRSHVLNPLNHIPRLTLVDIPSEHGVESLDEPVTGDRSTLLTLPEQRRSRQNSPNTPTFQDSFVQDRENNHRAKVALPWGHRSGAYSSTSGQVSMARSENHAPSILPAARSPTERQEGDSVVDSTLPKLASTYGFSQVDQPAQPPRRISSQYSLQHEKSATGAALPPPSSTAPQQPPELEAGQQQIFDEEPAWGPSHPCFDHMNPHVPLDSAEYRSTRVIRIRRDWMAHGDLSPAYSNIYPEILDHLLPEDEFRRIINHINTTLARAYDPFSIWNWVDGAMGLLTGWLWEDLRGGGIKGELSKLDKWIESWNTKVGAAHKDKVRIIPLRRTGYLCLDIQIPDPGVHVIDPNMREEESGTPRPTTQNTVRSPGS